jgi:processing peptidase subunit beta
MGARYSSHTDREITNHNIQCFANDAGRAVSVLGDIICNSSWNTAELEVLKDRISSEHEGNHERFQETLLENCHFNAFREHMLGQPKKGDRDLTSALTVDHLKNYHNANFYGDNIVVVATGNVNHNQIVDAVSKHF